MLFEIRSTLALTLALAVFVSAQSFQVDPSCDAHNIVETCVSQYAPTITACVGGDYACQCTAYTNLLTCYNNCPNDKNSSGVKSSVTSFCNAAAAASSASSLTNTATSTSGTGSSTAASSKPTSSGSPTTTKAPSSSSSSSSGSGSTNAALALTPAGTYGALAGVMAIAGIFL